MTKHDLNFFADPVEDDTGVFFDDFISALSAWSFMQETPPTIAQASDAFNVAPAIVRKAINEHAWMFIAGDAGFDDQDTIEHDGE